MDNNFPTEAEIQQAIDAAVATERQRIYAGLVPLHGIVRDEYLRSLCFPNGEPTAEDSSADQTNPPAGDRP